MQSRPDSETVEAEGDYIHVRFRDPAQSEQIRTPDWAEDVAESVHAGSDAG